MPRNAVGIDGHVAGKHLPVLGGVLKAGLAHNCRKEGVEQEYADDDDEAPSLFARRKASIKRMMGDGAPGI